MGQSAEETFVTLHWDEMKARLIKKKFRNIPGSVRSLHAKGTVNILVKVDGAGRPIHADVISTGAQNRCRIRELLEWKFEPLEIEGRRRSFRGVVTLNFCYGNFYDSYPC